MGQGDRLTAILITGYLGNNLGSNITGSREGVRLFNQRTGNYCAVLEHIFQIDQTAVHHVLHKVVAVMEVDNTLFVRLLNVIRHKQTVSNIAAYLAGDVVSLSREDCGIFVAVLLDDCFIDVIRNREDFAVQRRSVPQKLMFIAILDVRFGDYELALFHQLSFNVVLDFLNRNRTVAPLIAVIQTGGDFLGHLVLISYRTELFNLRECLGNGVGNFAFVKVSFTAITFNDNHKNSSLQKIAVDNLVNFFPRVYPERIMSYMVKATIMGAVKKNFGVFAPNQVVWGIVNQNVTTHHLLVAGKNDVLPVQEGEQL